MNKILLVHNEPKFLEKNIRKFCPTFDGLINYLAAGTPLNDATEYDMCIIFDDCIEKILVRAKYVILRESEPEKLRFYLPQYYHQFDEVINFKNFVNLYNKNLIIPSFLLFDGKDIPAFSRSKLSNSIVYIESGSMRNIYHFYRYITVRLIKFIVNYFTSEKLDIVEIKKSPKSKAEIYNAYSKALVVENVNELHYVSEKLLDAALLVKTVYYLGSKGKLSFPFKSKNILSCGHISKLLKIIMFSNNKNCDHDAVLETSAVLNAHWINYVIKQNIINFKVREISVTPASSHTNLYTKFRYTLISLPKYISYLKRRIFL